MPMRVPVSTTIDNDFFMRFRSGEKFLADPAEVFLALFRERNAGADSGVDKCIVADNDLVLETRDKIDVLPGKQFRNAQGQLRHIQFHIFLHRDVVTQYRLAPANPVEKPHGFFVTGGCREIDFFVIAHQETDVSECFPGLHRGVDNPGAVRSPVHQIAEKDDFTLDCTAFAIILDDLVQQPLQKIIAAMDIANRVYPSPVGDGRAVERPRWLVLA